jgi:putative serine/threonine protein kinase
MKHEAKLLRKANSLSIGPTLLNASRDFLLMQFIEGELLPIWLEKRHSRAKVREILHEILEQCYRLDKAGLDHGELSHAPKHVLVDDEDRPFVVDFETASLNRRPANVTSMCQFLFVGGATAEQVAKKFGGTNKELILESLRRYKNDRSYENFQSVLKACGV